MRCFFFCVTICVTKYENVSFQEKIFLYIFMKDVDVLSAGTYSIGTGNDEEKYLRNRA